MSDVAGTVKECCPIQMSGEKRPVQKSIIVLERFKIVVATNLNKKIVVNGQMELQRQRA